MILAFVRAPSGGRSTIQYIGGFGDTSPSTGPRWIITITAPSCKIPDFQNLSSNSYVKVLNLSIDKLTGCSRDSICPEVSFYRLAFSILALGYVAGALLHLVRFVLVGQLNSTGIASATRRTTGTIRIWSCSRDRHKHASRLSDRSSTVRIAGARPSIGVKLYAR